MPDNGWETWAKRVLGDLENLQRAQEDLTKSINELRVEVAVLKTKAAIIGAAWGFILSVGVSIFSFFIHGGGAK